MAEALGSTGQMVSVVSSTALTSLPSGCRVPNSSSRAPSGRRAASGARTRPVRYFRSAPLYLGASATTGRFGHSLLVSVLYAPPHGCEHRTQPLGKDTTRVVFTTA